MNIEATPNQPASQHPAPRIGPRPLPLHLATAVWTWQSSEIGLPLLSGDWHRWNDASPASNGATPSPLAQALSSHQAELRKRLTVLSGQLAGLAPDGDVRALANGAFAQAVRLEGARRFDRLMQGILAYRHHKVRRDLPEPAVLAAEGTTLLLDYSAFNEGTALGDTALFMVPSLVNGCHVLDINAERSFMRAMARGGVHPYLIDWQAPLGPERDFDATAYVARLARLYDALRARHKGRIVIAGYCMGGLLALALALQRQEDCASLLLLATPWDFDADRAGQAGLLSSLPLLDQLVQAAGELPVDALQTLFYSLDPWTAVRKFQRFAGLPQDSAQARDFVLLEDWLNEGAPLAGPIARDCLLGWYGANSPGKRQWCVDGQIVDPSKFLKPALVIVPGQDRIVPPDSARALLPPAQGALPNAKPLELALGHIGMVVSAKAPSMLWQPCLAWLVSSGA